MQSNGRRDFLKQLGSQAGVIGVVGAGSALAAETVPAAPVEMSAMPPLPWAYTPLDPELVRKRAHHGYTKTHCCEGAFSAIVGELARQVGHPFDKIPLAMMNYGGSGVVGFGSLCGTLNGSGAAINLVCDKKTTEAVMTELMSWYATALLPTATSNEYAFKGTYLEGDPYTIRVPLVQSVAGDNLCHLSITHWCNAANKGSGSPERSERCARITGDVAAKAVELLNAVHDNTFKREHPVPAQASGCLKCHDVDLKSHTRSKMDCRLCHTNPPKTDHCNEFNQSVLQSPDRL